MQLEASSVCLCTHWAAAHFLNSATGDMHCTAVLEQHRNGTYYTQCNCEKFRLDNLKYLEDRSSASSLQ